MRKSCTRFCSRNPSHFSKSGETYMRPAEGFLLVYSITSRASFEELQDFHQAILRVKDQDHFPVVLVGNKCDLEYERQVGMSEGRDLARRFGCSFLEASAKLRINVDESFYALVRSIRKYNNVSTWTVILLRQG